MSITTRRLQSSEWSSYFRDLAADLDGMLVTVETISHELGAQPSAERAPLHSMGYDPKDDVFEVEIAGVGVDDPVMRHFVEHPRTIEVQGAEELVPRSISVLGDDGSRTVIGLFAPTMLAG